MLYECWALPHLPSNAARYFDYYQDGVLHPGTIHTVANCYAITDLSDWSQRIVRGWIHFTVNGGSLPTR